MLKESIFSDASLRPCSFRAALIAIVAVMLLFLAGLPAPAQNQSSPHKSTPHTKAGGSAESEVARGKYLVEGVAMCGQCHTPRDGNGNPDRSRWLEGGPLPWLPAKPNSNWPIAVPRIGGNPPANDADMIKLLTTGIWTNGARLRDPMPQFRMDRSDAEAVVAYLKSTTPKP